MKWLLVALLFCLAPVAVAAPVTVTSGEHEGFTRLVFDYGTPVDWRFGRTDDGYELALRGTSPAYDLRGVFRLIGRSRLAAIWADPGSGNLRIGIACACHAIPFEFRPGIVVVDLRDGPPPAGSSFETALDGGSPERLAARDHPRPRPRPAERPAGYDWLDLARNEPAPRAPVLPVPADPGLEPLRDLLLQQMGRGAAQGVVRMERPPAGPGQPLPDFASAQVRIGGGPPSALEPADALYGDLGAEGAACIAPDRLEFSAWADDRPVHEQWAEAMAGLSTEFDRTDPAALTRAARFLLALGFGAEARQLLRAFPEDLPDRALWEALARILDDEPGGTTVLAGQTACDGPVAMWSFLAEDKVTPGGFRRADAILLAFSALPLRLRVLLGPRLAERFIAAGDAESARAIRDAILRADPRTEGTTALIDAEISHETGDPAAAEAMLQSVFDAGGPESIDALMRLVVLRAGRGLPVDPALVPLLEAAVQERHGTTAEPQAQAALVLARAASGDPAGALAGLPSAPETAPAVWALLAGLGSDRQVLELAVPQVAETAAPETRAILARRLLDLGMQDAALAWGGAGPTGDVLLDARLDLARNDPRSALRGLAGDRDAAALPLRIAATAALGDHASEARLLDESGDQTGAARALARGALWPELAAAPDSTWQAVARDLSAPAGEVSDAGDLARAAALADAVSGTRSAILALLAETALP